MQPDQTSDQTPDQVVAADIEAYGDEFMPGAAEKLGKLWQTLASMPADQRAEELSRRLASPFGQRYRSPTFDPKSEPDPVRAAVRRHAGQLRDGAVDELAMALGPVLAGATPDRIAGEVHRRLHRPENVGYLKNPPPPPHYHGRLDELLAANFGDLMSADGRAALIARDGRAMASLSDQAILSRVALSLKSPANAQRFGNGSGQTIAPNDPRLFGRGERTTPARQPSGWTEAVRFAGESTAPPRRSLIR